MFGQKDVAEYYDTTQIHYRKWWSLDKHLSLHYGIWDKTTKTFGEAIVNTNKLLLELSNIMGSDKVLDAGCGVGGAAFFINNTTKAQVTGISLSQRQITLANELAQNKQVTDNVAFHIMDFAQTDFASESFDVVWACESVCHAPDKGLFIQECFRILKKGGRLILADFFVADQHQEDKNNWIEKWQNTWAVQSFDTTDSFTQNLKQNGFLKVDQWDYTPQIHKSARRLFYAAILGTLPSVIYNALHPNVSRFSKNHYKCGYYQYRALQEKLWNYNIILAEK